MAEINQWGEAVANQSSTKIGITHVYLDGSRDSCRNVECNLGNMLTDAFISETITFPDEEKWNTVNFAVQHGGGIRASIVQGTFQRNACTTNDFQNCAGGKPYSSQSQIILTTPYLKFHLFQCLCAKVHCKRIGAYSK